MDSTYILNLASRYWSLEKAGEFRPTVSMEKALVLIETSGCEYSCTNGERWYMAVYKADTKISVGLDKHLTCYATAPSCDNCPGDLIDVVKDIVGLDEAEKIISLGFKEVADILRDMVFKPKIIESTNIKLENLLAINPKLQFYWMADKDNEAVPDEPCQELHIFKNVLPGESPAGVDCDEAYGYCGCLSMVPLYQGYPVIKIDSNPPNLPICKICLNKYLETCFMAVCPKCKEAAACSHKEIGGQFEYWDRYDLRCLFCGYTENICKNGGNTEQQNEHTNCSYCGASSGSHPNVFND